MALTGIYNLKLKENILFILHLPPPVHGHGVMGSYIQGSTLVNDAFNCTYINLSVSPDLESIGKASFKKYLAVFGIGFKVIKALLTTKYSLCYMTPSARTPAFFKDFLIILIIKLFGAKIIYHFHNKGVAVSSTNKLIKSVYRFSFKNSKVILLSKLLYPDVEQYVSVDNVYICPNGIPVSTPPSPKLLNADPRRATKLLLVSNLVIEKGIFVLLNACELLKNKGHNCECHFVGDYAEISKVDFLNKIADMGLAKNVFAYGKKYNQEKLDFYRQADIFVFPTYYRNETFGLVNLEAMQFNLPIISTNIGGIPDVINDGETGLIVRAQDPTDLADKIEILINSPELRIKMGNAGRERLDTCFTLPIFEKNIVNILKRALSNIR